jgi:hypothetical protein
VLRIRDGIIADAGSWVYVWLRPGAEKPVIYVGVTGLPPAVRTWLHLHHPDPEVGRVRGRWPDALAQSLDVLTFRLSDSAGRGDAKAAVIAGLDRAGLLAEDYLGDPPAADSELDALVESVLAQISAPSAAT